MFPGSEITGLDRPSCLEDLIRRLRVLLHPVPLPLQMEGGGSNECWLNLGWEWVKKKKRKPHHSCVIQLPPRTFILLGIYSYAHDEFNLWGNVRDSDGTRATLLWCEDTVVEGSQAARESGWKPFLTRWHKGLGQREKTEGLGSLGMRSKKVVESREVLGMQEVEAIGQKRSREERRPGNGTARDAAISWCLF